MPFRYELTWISHAKRWRKRYRGQTYYLKTDVGGKADRQGYLAALDEWKRVKAFADGFGPNPYSPSGALIPIDHQPQPVTLRQSAGVERERFPHDPPWIQSRGIAASLHPEMVVREDSSNVLAEERRVSALVTRYTDSRRQEAERGDLSLKMYDETGGRWKPSRAF